MSYLKHCQLANVMLSQCYITYYICICTRVHKYFTYARIMTYMYSIYVCIYKYLLFDTMLEAVCNPVVFPCVECHRWGI